MDVSNETPRIPEGGERPSGKPESEIDDGAGARADDYCKTEEALQEALEETFPASDPMSSLRTD